MSGTFFEKWKHRIRGAAEDPRVKRGFAMRNAFKRFMPVTDDEIERIRQKWQRAHPNIANFWHVLARTVGGNDCTENQRLREHVTKNLRQGENLENGWIINR